MKREKLLDRGSEADVTVRKSIAGTVMLLTKQTEMCSTAGFLVNNNLKKAK